MNFRLSLFLFMAIGFIISVILLYPVHDYVSYHEQVRGMQPRVDEFTSAWEFVFSRITEVFRGERFSGTVFFGLVGALIGSIFFVFVRGLNNNKLMIENLQGEINRDIKSIIERGESAKLEFKSSFRWDDNKNGVNKALEVAVLKTIAAFMNCAGGALLIGVSDEGVALGLDKDYGTLKTKNRDGFEVALMTAISNKLGSPQCAKVTVLFHDVDGFEVCHVISSKASKPVFLESGKETKFFLRAGAGTQELNVKETTEYIADHW